MSYSAKELSDEIKEQRRIQRKKSREKLKKKRADNARRAKLSRENLIKDEGKLKQIRLSKKGVQLFEQIKDRYGAQKIGLMIEHALMLLSEKIKQIDDGEAITKKTIFKR